MKFWGRFIGFEIFEIQWTFSPNHNIALAVYTEHTQASLVIRLVTPLSGAGGIKNTIRRNKKTFQLKANRPLANRYMVNKFEQVQQGVPSEQVWTGPAGCPKWTSLNRSSRESQVNKFEQVQQGVPSEQVWPGAHVGREGGTGPGLVFSW